MSCGKNAAPTKKVLEFMALNELPFSVVEDLDFRNLMHHLSSQYNMLSRKYFSVFALPELFGQVIQKTVCSLLKADAKTLCFTTHSWISDVSLMCMLWAMD